MTRLDATGDRYRPWKAQVKITAADKYREDRIGRLVSIKRADRLVVVEKAVADVPRTDESE